MNEFDFYMPLDQAVEYATHRLKSYAVQYYREGTDFQYSGPDRMRGIAEREIRAALIKDQVEQFKPIIERSKEVCISVPANWFEHLKESLPADLRFGWLEARQVKRCKVIECETTINIHSYSVYATENSQEVVHVLNKFEFGNSRRCFKRVMPPEKRK
jgi:hypothetical protein